MFFIIITSNSTIIPFLYSRINCLYSPLFLHSSQNIYNSIYLPFIYLIIILLLSSICNLSYYPPVYLMFIYLYYFLSAQPNIIFLQMNLYLSQNILVLLLRHFCNKISQLIGIFIVQQYHTLIILLFYLRHLFIYN